MQVDVFSYGVLLWELVTKELPQRGHMRDVRVPKECVPLYYKDLEIINILPACTFGRWRLQTARGATIVMHANVS